MPRPSLGLKKINFHIEPSVLNGLRWLAKSKGTTYSELIRVATKEYVFQELKKEQDVIATLSVAQEEEVADG